METVQEIFNWFKHFDQQKIVISTDDEQIFILLRSNQLPHLLGLQYQFQRSELKNISPENLVETAGTLPEILNQVKVNYPHMIDDVKDRILYLKSFLENLKQGFIVDSTRTTGRPKSTQFVIQTKDKKFLHLGLKPPETNSSAFCEFEQFSIIDKNEIERTEKVLETFFGRKNGNYFLGSPVRPITKIERLLENNQRIPFSFKQEAIEVNKLYVYVQNNYNLAGEENGKVGLYDLTLCDLSKAFNEARKTFKAFDWLKEGKAGFELLAVKPNGKIFYQSDFNFDSDTAHDRFLINVTESFISPEKLFEESNLVFLEKLKSFQNRRNLNVLEAVESNIQPKKEIVETILPKQQEQVKKPGKQFDDYER